MIILSWLASAAAFGPVAFIVKWWKPIALALALSGAAYGGYHLRSLQDDHELVRTLQTRLLAISMTQERDAQRATADKYFISKLDKLARETPANAGPCLDAAAAHRVWTVRQSAIAGTTPVPARRVPNVLPWRSGSP